MDRQQAAADGERSERKRRACAQCFKHCQCSACFQVWCGESCCKCESEDAEPSSCCGGGGEGEDSCASKVFFCNFRCGYIILQIFGVLSALAIAGAHVWSTIEVVDLYTDDIPQIVRLSGESLLCVLLSIVLLVAYITPVYVTKYFGFLATWWGCGLLQLGLACWAFNAMQFPELIRRGSDSISEYALISTSALALVFIIFGAAGGKGLDPNVEDKGENLDDVGMTEIM